jgi:hypothetical protein
MITGVPSVAALKCLRSDGSRQGMSPSRPITPFRAGGDEGDFDVGGVFAHPPAHTAIGAEIAGCGS